MFKFNDATSRKRFRRKEKLIGIGYGLFLTAVIACKVIGVYEQLVELRNAVTIRDYPILFAELAPLLNMVVTFLVLSYQLRKNYCYDYNINKKTMNYIFFFEVALVAFIWI